MLAPMIHRRIAGVVTLAAALLLTAAVADGHKTHYPSTIEILGWGSSMNDGNVDYAYGVVRSDNPKCVGGRTVEIKRAISGQMQLIDTATTSSTGFWAGGGDPEIGSGGIVILKKERIGKRKGHRHVCGGASELFD
jgi:hypothetical protein